MARFGTHHVPSWDTPAGPPAGGDVIVEQEPVAVGEPDLVFLRGVVEGRPAEE